MVEVVVVRAVVAAGAASAGVGGGDGGSGELMAEAPVTAFGSLWF